MTRSTTAPVLPVGRLLEANDSFLKTSIRKSPEWAMGARIETDEQRFRVATEFGPDTSDKLDAIRCASPKYSLFPRGKGFEPDGAWVPAPGSYKNPGTLERTHPTFKTTGRGFHWGSEERCKSAGASSPKRATPSPDNYDPRPDANLDKPPSWSMTSRSTEYPAQHKGDLWSSCDKKMPSVLYNTQGKLVKGGTAWTPSWTFNNRPESCFVPKRGHNTPGPGSVNSPGPGVGIKRSPSFGFGSAPRFGKDAEMRPY